MSDEEAYKAALQIVRAKVLAGGSFSTAIPETAEQRALRPDLLEALALKAWPDLEFGERQLHQRAKNEQRRSEICSEAWNFADDFMARQKTRPTPVAVLPAVAVQNWARRRYTDETERQTATNAAMHRLNTTLSDYRDA